VTQTIHHCCNGRGNLEHIQVTPLTTDIGSEWAEKRSTTSLRYSSENFWRVASILWETAWCVVWRQKDISGLKGGGRGGTHLNKAWMETLTLQQIPENSPTLLFL
jgi:hypothetical protein